MNKINTFSDTPNWLIQQEVFTEGVLIWHIEIRNWSIGIAKDLLVFVYDNMPTGVRNFAPYVDEKQGKFMALLGFAPSPFYLNKPTGKVQLWSFINGH